MEEGRTTPKRGSGNGGRAAASRQRRRRRRRDEPLGSGARPPSARSPPRRARSRGAPEARRHARRRRQEVGNSGGAPEDRDTTRSTPRPAGCSASPRRRRPARPGLEEPHLALGPAPRRRGRVANSTEHVARRSSAVAARTAKVREGGMFAGGPTAYHSLTSSRDGPGRGRRHDQWPRRRIISRNLPLQIQQIRRRRQ